MEAAFLLSLLMLASTQTFAAKNPYALPTELRCSETVSDLTILKIKGQWFARSVYFKQNDKYLSFVEVSVTPNESKDEFIISAIDSGVEVHTFYPKNDGYLPFYNLKIKTSPDYSGEPARAILQNKNGHPLVEYTCCAAPLSPGVRGRGLCR